MKNTIYLDGDFNFLLLENEEEDTGLSQTKIYINIPTSDATNQELEISVAGGAPITESIPSGMLVEFELTQQYWADNGDVEITPKNDDITGDTITLHFPETFTVRAALNYIYDDEFEIVAQNEDFAEGGGGSGSGSGGGSAFDFVETIRNIGFRLLDEPSNVNAYFDKIAEEVQIKWTDPADIITNEPVPATWAGTIVVRKEGSAPLHRWDGNLLIDSTIRDAYKTTPLVDNTAEYQKNYYYGIFPYDTRGDYRYTKIVALNSASITRNVVNVNAATQSLNNLVGNFAPISVYGTFPTYKSETQSYYFGVQTYLWKYANGTISREELASCELIHAEFEALLTTEAIGQYSNIAYQIRPYGDDVGNYKLIQCVAGSGNAAPPIPLLRLNNYTEDSTAKAPLDFNYNAFHKVVIDVTLENLVVKRVKSEVDGLAFSDESLNVTLDVQDDLYTYYFECTDHSYLKNLYVRIE